MTPLLAALALAHRMSWTTWNVGLAACMVAACWILDQERTR